MKRQPEDIIARTFEDGRMVIPPPYIDTSFFAFARLMDSSTHADSRHQPYHEFAEANRHDEDLKSKAKNARFAVRAKQGVDTFQFYTSSDLKDFSTLTEMRDRLLQHCGAGPFHSNHSHEGKRDLDEKGYDKNSPVYAEIMTGSVEALFERALGRRGVRLGTKYIDVTDNAEIVADYGRSLVKKSKTKKTKKAQLDVTENEEVFTLPDGERLFLLQEMTAEKSDMVIDRMTDSRVVVHQYPRK